MNAIFPASYSTLCPDALADLLDSKYPFGPVKCRFIVRGVGDTYMIETPGINYILRIYRSSHRNFSQIRSETELLAALKEAGVSVSFPVPDRSGNMIQTFEAAEGLRHGVVFSYAPGNSLSVLNDRQLRHLGTEMAAFHNVSATIELSDKRWIFDLDTILFQPLLMVKDAFAEDPEGYAWLQYAAKRIQEKLAGFNTAAFSSGYCHFDFLPKNFHFDKDDKITFFDFDFFGHGWLINDLMIFWQHLCLDVFLNRMSQEAADNSFAIFLEAYRERRPVSEEELSAMPWLSLGFWLFYMGFHTTHDQFYPFIFQPAALKIRINAVRKLIERYCPEIIIA